MANLLERGRTMLGRGEQEAALDDYLHNGGVNLDPATQAWCASFVNATLAQEGFPKAKANARSFEKYGDPVLTPRAGDIGVFAREEDPKHIGWEGHAAIATGESDMFDNPVVLSGNANDMVMEHAIDPNRLIGWRRPPGMQEPPTRQPLLSPQQQAAVPDAARGLDTVSQRLPTPNDEWVNRYRNREIAFQLNQLQQQQQRLPSSQQLLAGIRDIRGRF